MHYIRDIFENKENDHAHSKFVRYSKGIFTGPMLTLKFEKSQVKVSTSFHLVDELLFFIAQKIGDCELDVRGSLSWNKDLGLELERNGIKYLKASKSRGIFKYELKNKVKFKSFVETFINYNLFISFEVNDIKFTCKDKAPKASDEVVADFCKLKIPYEYVDSFMKDFCFDIKDKSLKNIEISNGIEINDIIFPAGKLSFEDIRRLSKRKGKIIRKIIINKKDETKHEKEFMI